MGDEIDYNALEQHVLSLIKKPDRIFKNGKDLYIALKAKMTKKELKLLISQSAGISEDAITEKLNLDAERHKAIVENISKKLNSDKVKQALAGEG